MSKCPLLPMPVGAHATVDASTIFFWFYPGNGGLPTQNLLVFL